MVAKGVLLRHVSRGDIFNLWLYWHVLIYQINTYYVLYRLLWFHLLLHLFQCLQKSSLPCRCCCWLTARSRRANVSNFLHFFMWHLGYIVCAQFAYLIWSYLITIFVISYYFFPPFYDIMIPWHNLIPCHLWYLTPDLSLRKATGHFENSLPVEVTMSLSVDYLGTMFMIRSSLNATLRCCWVHWGSAWWPMRPKSLICQHPRAGK